jgi:hypothetical protein
MIDNPVTLLAPACDVKSGKREGGIIRNLQPQELLSSSSLSSSPRETNPLPYAFMHLSKLKDNTQGA